MDKKHRQGIAAILAAAPMIVLGLVNGFYLEAVVQHAPLYWTAELVQWILVPVACLVALKFQAGVGPTRYGFTLYSAAYPGGKLIGASIIATLLLGATYHPSSALAWRLFPVEPPSFSYENVVVRGVWEPVVDVYYAASAAFVEEIAFRALPWFGIVALAPARLHTPIYVAATSVLFALIHWEHGAPELLATFWYGVVAALVYRRLLNLWPLIAAHFLVDVIDFW